MGRAVGEQKISVVLTTAIRSESFDDWPTEVVAWHFKKAVLESGALDILKRNMDAGGGGLVGFNVENTKDPEVHFAETNHNTCRWCGEEISADDAFTSDDVFMCSGCQRVRVEAEDGWDDEA